MTIGGTPPLGKRAQLRADRRRKRRRLAGGGLGAAVMVLLVVGLVWLNSGGAAKQGPHKPSRTQRTVLFQIQAADGTAVSSALLGHDSATGNAAIVLVPPQVLAQVPGVGNMSFSKALSTGGLAGARNALSDLMSVTIDGSWVLSQAAFERLVDQEGGVSVTVDVPVLNGRAVLLAPGTQRLGGAQAFAFATYLAPGTQEQARLARLNVVLDAVLMGLPADPAPAIGALGPGSQTTLSVPILGELLNGVHRDDVAQNLQYRELPVIPVSSGTDDIVFRVDAPATKQLVAELFPTSMPPGAGATGNRVLVLNGVGTPGIGAVVRDRLVPAGFVYVTSRNASRFDYAATQVLVKDATPEAAAIGARVARALGVPVSSVSTSDQIGTIADVVVIIGRDFKAK